jgi:hypothetical protein
MIALWGMGFSLAHCSAFRGSLSRCGLSVSLRWRCILAKDQHPVQALAAHGADQAFR